MIKPGTGGIANADEYLSSRFDLHTKIVMNDMLKASKAIFRALDSGDLDTFMLHFSDDADFTFGSQDTVHGISRIRAYVAGFIATTERMEHAIEAQFCSRNILVAHGTTFYHMKNGNQKKIPFCDKWIISLEGKIKDYRIYCDPTGLL